ncbi:MAG: hypothetical protein WBL31_02935 [Ilumatobacteraceae bacterium]
MLASALPARADAVAVAAPVVRQALPVGNAATALLPLPPCRLFDARRTPDLERIDASTWRLSVVGRCGVPASARSVAVSIVATGTTAPGFVTVSPGGTPRPDVSNLNYERGNTVANSAVVKLGSSGSIDVHTSAPAEIIIDVTGVFVETPAAVSAGRFVAADPTRVVDTRVSAPRGDGEIRVPLPAGVPRDAIALAVSVTAVDAATDGGYLSVYPAGGQRSDTSVVNTDEHNRTRANAVFVAVGADGFVVFRSMETDVLVDVWGWFTGPSAPPSTDGLFVPQEPTRVWDSRLSLDPVHRGGTVERDLALDAAAIVANVTVVEPTGAGFVSVFAAGTPRPDVSSLNYRWRQPVAALTVSRLSDRGVALHSFAGAHLLVDVAGWFTGAAVAATTPPPANDFPPGDSEVLFVSDSSFAGIRWNGALPVLAGAAFDSRLESCRRLIGASCRGREGYAPRTAERELATATFGRYDTAIVAVGYNDSAFTFSRALDAVIAMARLRGIDRVMWLTYRENVGYVSPAGVSNSASFVAMNQWLRSAAASGRYPELIVADWHAYSFVQRGWLTSDGVHFTVAGARAAAEYVSRKMAAIERRPCPATIGGPSTPGGWCADPDLTGPPGD